MSRPPFNFMSASSEIRDLLKGITFVSETDSPFVVARVSSVLDTDEFFSRLVRQNRSAFIPVVNWISKNLSGVKVTAKGRIKVTYEIQGVTNEGELLRIITYSVET